MEPANGIEPSTFSLQVRRTANCATPAFTRPIEFVGLEPTKIFVSEKIYYPSFELLCGSLIFIIIITYFFIIVKCDKLNFNLYSADANLRCPTLPAYTSSIKISLFLPHLTTHKVYLQNSPKRSYPGYELLVRSA